MGGHTDIRNRREFVQKLKVIAAELRKRMVRFLSLWDLRPWSDYTPEKL
jgi:hypothetical protein